MLNRLKLGLFLLLPLILMSSWYLFVQQSPTLSPYSVKIRHEQNLEKGELSAPALPSISRYTRQNVIQKIPALSDQFEVEVGNMEKHHGFLPAHNLHEYYADLQDRIDSKVIVIKGGTVDVATLYNAVNDPELITAQNGGYLFHVPLYIRAGATFIARGLGQSIRLSQTSGAFISSQGNNFIVDTHITGWNTELGTNAAYENSETFRPFLLFWNNSQSYIANSRLTSLGYDASKAYGLTFSTHSVLTKRNPDLPWPTGWIVNSEFEDLYYGFYSYEAENIALVNNLYKDNIVHGIDPHDRSNNLIIANNETTGTKQKHGIIVSREVNNSWIFNNRSHGNQGAGIMLERNSHSNVVAYNKIYNNQDGLSFYESPNNTSWGNIIKNNQKNGVRIRNSLDITLRNENIIGNGRYGLEAYGTNDKNRDLRTAPYKEKTSFDISDSKFNDNSSGQIRTSDISSASFSNLQAFKIGAGFFKGDLKPQSLSLFNVVTQPGLVVLVQKQELYDQNQ